LEYFIFPEKQERFLFRNSLYIIENLENFFQQNLILSTSDFFFLSKNKKTKFRKRFGIIFEIGEIRYRYRKNIKLSGRLISPTKVFRRTVKERMPTFTKIAQALASRPDIIDKNIAKKFQRLQDYFPFLSNSEPCQLIRKGLGASP